MGEKEKVVITLTEKQSGKIRRFIQAGKVKSKEAFVEGAIDPHIELGDKIVKNAD